MTIKILMCGINQYDVIPTVREAPNANSSKLVKQHSKINNSDRNSATANSCDRNVEGGFGEQVHRMIRSRLTYPHFSTQGTLFHKVHSFAVVFHFCCISVFNRRVLNCVI